jgi:hypothetical protein
MFIIRLLFYLVVATMDSSFLTLVHVGNGIYALVSFLKLIIQFGLPNHPARFLCYIVSLSAAAYLVGLAATDLGYLSPWIWMRWRALPLVAGSVCLLFQVITLVGHFSLLQQKVISRLPLMGALLCFAFFQEQASLVAGGFILAAALFFSISVGKARFQKRLFQKMTFFFLLWNTLRLTQNYWAFVVAEALLTFGLFYLFLFEQSVAVAAVVDDFRTDLEGDLA